MVDVPADLSYQYQHALGGVNGGSGLGSGFDSGLGLGLGELSPSSPLSIGLGQGGVGGSRRNVYTLNLDVSGSDDDDDDDVDDEDEEEVGEDGEPTSHSSAISPIKRVTGVGSASSPGDKTWSGRNDGWD